MSSPASAWDHGKYITSYLGFAGTRGNINPTLDSTNLQVMSRTMFYVRSVPVDGKIQLLDGNWYVDPGNVEHGSGGTIVETASLEYPLGTCTPLTWSSVSSVTIANGANAISDAVAAPPVGALAAIRRYTVASAASPMNEGFGSTVNAILGDATHYGASGIADQTVSCGTVINTTTGDGAFPLGILGNINKPAVCIIGDSIAFGGGGNANSVGDAGDIAQSIGPSFGYINISVSGTTAQTYISSSAKRSALYQYCTHLISEYGTNDLYTSGRSAAQLESDLNSVYSAATNLVSPAQVFQTTLIPRTNSTDSWATTINQSYQTSPSAGESARATFNSALRAASFSPNGGMFDTDSILEVSPLNSGWWVNVAAGFPQCSPWTGDGTHPNNCGYAYLQSNGVIDVSRIHYP